VDLGEQDGPNSLLVHLLYHHLVEQYDGTPYQVELSARYNEILTFNFAWHNPCNEIFLKKL